MWHQFKNIIYSLKTYNALSPDLKIRRQVNQLLLKRPALSCQQWFQTFYQPQGMTYAIVNFAYQHLAQYSGLDFSRVLPDDRLNEDLQWTQVCWFDWQLQLYEDFWQQFEVDISDRFDESTLPTVTDLILFLQQQSCKTIER